MSVVVGNGGDIDKVVDGGCFVGVVKFCASVSTGVSVSLLILLLLVLLSGMGCPSS